MKLSDQAQKTLQSLLESFESGDIPEAMAKTMIPMPDIPMARWSFGNKLICMIYETNDARTFLQWKEARRFIKPGSKAFYILAPLSVRKKKTNDDGIEQTYVRLIGFKGIPVFRIEDTEGDPVEYPPIVPPEMPPLFDVAHSWGIDVTYAPCAGDYYGVFMNGRNKIKLCTHDEQTFFHELGHAAHEKAIGKLKGGQHWDQEIVAELTGAVLASMFGKKVNAGGSFQYIKTYADRADKETLKACFEVVNDVKKCLVLIVGAHVSVAEAAG